MRGEKTVGYTSEVNRLSCENRIRAISLKYNISSDDISIIMEIPVLDHVILGDNLFYSYKENKVRRIKL